MRNKSYDDTNIFSKILRGEISCEKVFESEYSLAFRDIYPKAPTHVLVIPKKHYVSLNDFSAKADIEELSDIFKTIIEVVEIEGIKNTGYRVTTNTGRDANQEVEHLHFHIIGGRKLGRSD